MKLEYLGYNDNLETFRIEHNLGNFEIGRVVAEHIELTEKALNQNFTGDIL